MKKYLTVAMFLVLAVVLISPVSASAATKAGVKSGSFFYFFDKAFEKTNLFFTFNPEKKAKKALEYAEERLAEAEESASENKPEAVSEAMENYQENISLAETEAKAIKDETKTKDLLSTIASSTSKHQEILTEVLNKVPQEAKEAIEKAIEASKKGREEAMKETEDLEKEVPEIKQESEGIKNEDEQSKSNDDKEDNKKNESKKDEQKKEIEKLKKEVETLKQKQIVPKQSTLETQNSQEQKKTEWVRSNAEETIKIATEKYQEEAKIKTEQERLREVERLADQQVAEEKQKELERQQQLENQRLAEEKAKADEIGTKVQGIISQNTVWTVQNGPYIVTDDIVIEKNITLTIDPGVIIKFKKGSGKSNFGGFEILNRGNIIAKGNSNNKIVFTSYESNLRIGSWGTIEIVSGGSANFDNVEVKYAGTGITASNASSLIITNSIFSNNGTGIFVTGPAIISNNIIENNNSGIIYCGITYSARDDGTFLYFEVRKTEIKNNIIRNNIGGLKHPYNAGVVIQDLVSSGFSLELTYNDIYNNGNGINFVNSKNLQSLLIKNNNIYNHSDYNIWFNGQGSEITMPDNWWGTADISAIDSKMYDYKLNPVTPLPKINYQPFATSEISDAGVR